MLSRVLCGLFLIISVSEDFILCEPCIIEATGEVGECIPFQQCRSLVDAYKLDRSTALTVCNREMRAVCCPAIFMPKPVIDPTTTTTEASIEQDLNAESFIASQIIKKCKEFKNLMMKNETIESFVYGEPPIVKSTPICHQNKANIGIGSEKEFPHIALIRLKSLPRNRYRTEIKCVGSLISDRFVLTSSYCIKFTGNLKSQYHINVELGVFHINSVDLSMSSFKAVEVSTKFGITLLKLDRKVVFNEFIQPICFYPDKQAASEFLLTGWTGDWLECDPKLKKWHIENHLVDHEFWRLTIDEAAIINYRQTLLPGSPLQIYHPDSDCQYALVGVLERLHDDQYIFMSFHRHLQWIESVVWPRRLQQKN